MYRPISSTFALIFMICFGGCARGVTIAQDSDVSSETNDAAEGLGSNECEGAEDGSPCDEGEGFICLGETCVLSRCGDGFVDEGEECDDGNSILRDGCENDCTATCRTDDDCDDGNLCNGFERCQPVGNGGGLCAPGTPPNCDGAALLEHGVNPCVLRYCDPNAESLETACQIEDHAIYCYPDEDEDGYPVHDVDRRQATVGLCECPPKTARQRVDGAWDCNDNNPMVRPDLPASLYFTEPYCGDGTLAIAAGQAPCAGGPEGAMCIDYECADGSTPSFDYDCDGVALKRDDSTGGRCTFVLLGCSGKRAFEVDEPVPCGGEASYALCESAFLQKCEREVRAQECR